jgi:hypothetical protein
MSKEKVSYELNERHQLLDLNQKLVNFKLEFKVESEPQGQDFYAIVMNQNQINEYEKLDQIEMKTAPGKIGGTIVADNNKYQNYFLILKAKDKNSIKVNVFTDIQEIEPKIIEENIAENIAENLEENYTQEETSAPESITQVPIYKKPWFWLVAIVAIAVLGYLSYDYIMNRKLQGKSIFGKNELNPTTTQPTLVPTEAAISNIPAQAVSQPSIEDQMYHKVGTIA